MRTKNNNLTKYVILILIAGFIFQACKKNEDTNPVTPVIHERGDISEVNSMGVFSTDEIQQMLNDSKADLPFSPKYVVEALSISYYTCDDNGNIIKVSGAIFIPQTDGDFPLLSIQHGTETKSDLVASVYPDNSTEGVIALLTASMDYVTLVPDYPGFGVSTGMHPYLHAASIVPSVVDFIKAGQNYCLENGIKLKDELFLTGYSEGGYVSLLAQKSLEESYANEIKLTAVAPLSGPYDLRGMFDKIFQDGSYSSPAYVAYFLTAYNNIYGWNNLERFFKEQYAALMPGLFDGSKSWGEISSALPVTLKEMMNPEFMIYYPALLIDYEDSKMSGLVSVIHENTMLEWKPETQLHFFHGDCDNVVYCMNTLNAVNAFKENGAKDVYVTTIAGGDHESSGPKAIRGALVWFENIRKRNLTEDLVNHHDN